MTYNCNNYGHSYSPLVTYICKSDINIKWVCTYIAVLQLAISVKIITIDFTIAVVISHPFYQNKNTWAVWWLVFLLNTDESCKNHCSAAPLSILNPDNFSYLLIDSRLSRNDTVSINMCHVACSIYSFPHTVMDSEACHPWVEHGNVILTTVVKHPSVTGYVL